MINIRELRKEHKLSQTQLGKLIGVTKQAISNIETGKAQPDVKTARRLGEALGFDWWKLYE